VSDRGDELFQCVVHDMRLTRAGCGDFWRVVNQPATRAVADDHRAQVFARCMGCPIGAAHARSEAPAEAPATEPELVDEDEEDDAGDVAERHETKREENTMPKTTQRSVDKLCASCGDTFVATHGPQKYCAKCKTDRGASKTAKTATPEPDARKPRKLRELPVRRKPRAVVEDAPPAPAKPGMRAVFEALGCTVLHEIATADGEVVRVVRGAS
jgi:hypothetical protein